MALATELHLRIVTPTRTIVDRAVRSVQFTGVDGSYGILPNHAPLLTATAPGIVTIEGVDGKKEELLVTDGFAEMRENTLTLVCDAGERAGEIDLERAREAERRARERIAGAHEPGGAADLPRAQEALRRAMLRQLVARRAGTGDVR